MISAFKHIRLSGYNLLPQSNNGNIRLTLNNSGVAYFSELSTASGILNTKIDAFSGTFQSFVNNLSTDFTTDAELVAASGVLQTNINTVATNLASTGAANLASISSLSGTLTSTYATITNLASTGSNLQAQINNLDSIYATDASVTTVANNLATTGSTLQTNIDTVATNLASTGAANLASISSLSGTLTSEYVRKATQQQFIVTLPINVESTGITFPVAFASTPNSVQVTFEPSTDVAYMVAVKNRTTAGFTAEFSDVLFEAGNKLNVFASV
jgi:hypothetical protein